ncbi:ExbD/TolR family protein [Paraburkholderia caballeronis]|uniref:Outer membrane transport energization protein ExbD n=1 Tax=Paraburkholderia caballeronis TaxID=416943 RepID=A0A1H7M373_9BURK|nr:biopolymer transporter ExbD [Paraburkholderia caballeronis]PXW28685.1 outer membrane transport energization protein ExbD [Paraburkholderia caballeronis]PXX04051.1 outer membrane transport energization protein ExbD [Paraburkholderia caballeronis]RAK04795.1 outer membrane transport energization protein ExbD [Paraburkholderia caballeronis]TDV19696.1 outer membrane transport energization protein ExbD [Paraburkholderia caballeronis]TDV22295.1 outer membrane transport energization protein ExbD [P
MAASFNEQDDMITEINMTPLIDVMLVLLIVFMVTLPAITNTVKLELPRADSAPSESQPQRIELSVDAGGVVMWNAQPVDEAALAAKLAAAAGQQPQPALQLYADRATRYEAVATLLAAAQRAGLTNINFITSPKS